MMFLKRLISSYLIVQILVVELHSATSMSGVAGMCVQINLQQQLYQFCRIFISMNISVRDTKSIASHNTIETISFHKHS